MRREMFGLFHLTVLCLLGGRSAADGDPVVDTPLGKVRGYTMTSRTGQTFLAFSGIPYAKPPLGQLRFQPPEPIPAWQGIKEAKEDGPFCIQYKFLFVPHEQLTGTEDCLYLSVYTKNITGKTPVLVHFHGGAFTMGNSKPAQPHFLMDEDIVIVNVNYRVGIYGFLTFETSEMPGNQGMKDQVMSLKWVQQNIASFGGDPNQVTIIGESAGASSVTFHIVSPLSKGLFHKAIAESGTYLAPWAMAPPGFRRSRAEKLMKLINCPTNQEEAIPCILEKDPKEVVSKFKNFLEWHFDPMLNFGPVIEPAGPNSFLVDPINEWKHNPVPLLTSITSSEGLFRTVLMLKDLTALKKFAENFDKLAPNSFLYFASASKPDEITKEIYKFYFPKKEKIALKDFNNLTLAYTDCWFTVPAMDFADKHNGKVYFYLFDYVSKAMPPVSSPIIPGMEKCITGATHLADTYYIYNFTNPAFILKMDRDDIELSKTLVKRVVHFMKKGIPDLDGSNLEWKTWTPEDHNYVLINRKGFHLKNRLADDRYRFWKTINYRDKYGTNPPLF